MSFQDILGKDDKDDDIEVPDNFAEGFNAGREDYKSEVVEKFSDFVDSILNQDLLEVYKKCYDQDQLLREAAGILREYKKRFGAI